MPKFESSKVTRASLIRAWNLAAETNADVLKLLKSIRVDLTTTQVIKTRRQLLELSATLGVALKEKQQLKPIEKHTGKALDLLDDIRRKLELMLSMERMDRDRMGVVIRRLDEIRSLVTGRQASAKSIMLVEDD